jgi:P-type E1-E2 ATPase
VREPEDVALALSTHLGRGLDVDDAARRLEVDGPNELAAATRAPAWRRFVAQLRDPLVYLLLAAVVVSAAAWLVEGASGVPVDALVITVIVLANAVLGLLQEAHAANAVAALRSMTEVSSVVVRGGAVSTVPSRELVVGDLLVLAEGDRVGADARLVRAAGLRVDESSLTGESTAVGKSVPSVAPGLALGDRSDMVHNGTAVTRGTGRGVVTATGMDTEVGDIARLLASTTCPRTPLEREIAAVGRYLGIAVGVIAVAVMATIWVVDGITTFDQAVMVFLLGVSLAVAAVPEGLPAILSVVLSVGVRRMADRHAIVKRLSSAETLGSASVICSDKTGTRPWPRARAGWC